MKSENSTKIVKNTTGNKRSKDFISGALAKSISVLFANPLNALKTQIESTGRETSFSQILSKMNKKPTRSYFSGFWATFWKDVPTSAIQFTLYNGIYDFFKISEKENKYYYIAAAASLSSNFTLLLFHPFEVMRVI